MSSERLGIPVKHSIVLKKEGGDFDVWTPCSTDLQLKVKLDVNKCHLQYFLSPPLVTYCSTERNGEA